MENQDFVGADAAVMVEVSHGTIFVVSSRIFVKKNKLLLFLVLYFFAFLPADRVTMSNIAWIGCGPIPS